MAPTANDQPQQPNEILIHGVLYDCTNLKHPGGSIYKFYLGSGDATVTFDEFHIKLPKAQAYLKNLPSRPAPNTHVVDEKEQQRLDKLTSTFEKLRSDCQKEGLYDANYPHIIYRFSELIALHVLGLYMLFNTNVPLLALFVLGIAEGRCGWWMHEAGHYSCTGIPKVDIKIQEIVYGLGDGMSGSWWRVQHNKHHAMPQQLKRDPDLETLPLVAFNKVIARRGKKVPIIRNWISVQRYLFAPITCSLVALYWQLYLHPRHIIRTKRYTEAAAIITRWVLVGIICSALHVSFWRGLGGVLFAQAFGAAYIFVSFALNHSHLEARETAGHAHFVEYAAKYTIDVRSNWFVNWFMGYLNFQVEHHLFPSMPQYHFVELWPRVKVLFEENGLVYDSRSYWSAFHTTFENLGEVGEYIQSKDD